MWDFVNLRLRVFVFVCLSRVGLSGQDKSFCDGHQSDVFRKPCCVFCVCMHVLSEKLLSADGLFTDSIMCVFPYNIYVYIYTYIGGVMALCHAS